MVVHSKFEPILGSESCIKFGLVKRMDINKIALPNSTEAFVEQYKDVFQGFGKFPGVFIYRIIQSRFFTTGNG